MAEMNKRSAARQIVACSLCRSRKVKCSGEIPCKNCVARGTECIVMEGKKRGPSVGLRKAKKGPKLDRTPQHFESVSPVQNDEQSTTSDGTLISAIESSLVENSQEQIFTHAFFRNVTLEDFDGNRLPFVDYYFKWANKLIPFFSKIWLESNFLDLPIYLLHSMFAMTLVTPYNKGKLGDEDRQSLFQKSFQFASKYLFELEDIDPFAVCGVIHLAGAALNVDQPNEVALLWSMAFNWAIRLELPLDVSPTWKTASNTDIRDINFCRSIWFFMYTYGHVGRIIYDMTFPETPDISAATIKDYITPNGEDATNISEK